MGNSANRSELRRILGSSFARKYAKKLWGRGELNYYLKALKTPIGKLYSDCDGFNHRVGKVTPVFVQGFIVGVDIEDENGKRPCSCTRHARIKGNRHPLSEPDHAELIAAYQEQWIKTEWMRDTMRGIEMQRLIDAGLPFVDSQGVLLPELANM